MFYLTIKKLAINLGDKELVNLTSLLKNPIHIKNSLALVGQSGSGKSLTLKTILGMVPQNLDVEFTYNSNFFLSLNNIGFIPQNPFTSLSPMTKIKKQFFQKDDIIDDALKTVDLDPTLKEKFPSQLSGGQLQRVIIAIILSKKPKIILLDEPTTALDTKSKNIVLDLLKNLQKRFSFIMIFISHDIESIKTICENIAILHNGKIIEYGKTNMIVNNPQQSYTKQLLKSNFTNRKFRT